MSIILYLYFYLRDSGFSQNPRDSGFFTFWISPGFLSSRSGFFSWNRISRQKAKSEHKEKKKIRSPESKLDILEKSHSPESHIQENPGKIDCENLPVNVI